MMINLIDRNFSRIILFFAISPGSRYSRKEIKEKTSMNNVPLDISLGKLLNLRIINEKNRLYFLNLENQIVNQILEEKEKFSNLPLNIQFILIEFIEMILKFKPIKDIVLFGSYTKLIFSDKSDIDIAVIFADKIKNRERIEKKISALSQKISKKYKKSVQEHFFVESDLKHKEDPLIKDILKNGRSLI